MIGPILEEVISWITDNDQKSLNNQLQQTQSSQTQNEVGGLIGLLAGLLKLKLFYLSIFNHF